MHSMLTEPVGPRSPDEILAVVYDRTTRVRRRRRTRLTAGAAMAAVALTGLVVTLQPSDKEARLHVVDHNPATEEAAEVRTVDLPAGESGQVASSPPSTTAKRHASKPAAAADTEGTVPPPVPPPTTTTTTLPSVRLLAEDVDAENDADPNSWYLDIVRGSMQFDVDRNIVVLTTRYRSPGAEAGNPRESHRMSTQVTFDQVIYAIEVDETDGVLSDVEIDGEVCEPCQATFVAAEGTLTVHVPLDDFNAAVVAQRGSDADRLGPQSEITDLTLVTERLLANLTSMQADTSKDTGGAQ